MTFFFFFSSRRRHTRWNCDWSSDVCSSDLLRPADHARGDGVDQLAVRLHVGKVAGDLEEYLVPHHHAEALRVGLGDESQVAPRPLPGEREGEAVDALHAHA